MAKNIQSDEKHGHPGHYYLLRILCIFFLVIASAVVLQPYAVSAENSTEEIPVLEFGKELSVTYEKGYIKSVLFTPDHTGAYAMHIEVPEESADTTLSVDYYVEESTQWRYMDGYVFYYGIPADYYFYVESGKDYKFDFSFPFGLTPETFTLSLSDTDKAGSLDGLQYAFQEERPDLSDSEMSVRIISYNGSENEITVPETINGYPVTIISGSAFMNSNITSITLHEGISTIESFAFKNCSELSQVTLPSTLINIGQQVFSGTPNLTEILFPNGSDYYAVENGALIEQNDREILYLAGGKRSQYTVPARIGSIEGEGLEDAAIEKLYFQSPVRLLRNMPSSLEELHFVSADCDLEYDGIPRIYDSATDKTYYKVHVYAPEGGTIESFCIEKGITFTAEGSGISFPMADPVVLTPGIIQGTGFNTLVGDYQDYTFTPESDGLYGINFAYGNFGYYGDPPKKMFTVSMTDNAGMEVQHVRYMSPGTGKDLFVYYYTLKAGETYCFRVQATDEAVAAGVNINRFELCAVSAEELAADELQNDLKIENYPVSSMSRIFHITPSDTAVYYIHGTASATDYAGTGARLYHAESDGSLTELQSGAVDGTKLDLCAELSSGESYYLVLTLELRRYNSGYCTLDDFVLTDHICDYIGHQIDFKDAVKETCTENGRKEHYYCTVCEKVFADYKARQEIEDPDTLIIPAHHEWGEWTETKAPTCSVPGEEQRICAADSSHVETREIPIISSAHSWGQWEETKAATCSAQGEEQRICTADPSHIEKRSILVDPAAHDWSEWTVTTPASDDTPGIETRICNHDPKHTETREIPAEGHNWGEWETEIPASCTEAGTEIRICRKDPTHVETREIPATGHDWEEWKITRAATTSKEGEETRICKHDPSHIERRMIDKLPQDPVIPVTPAKDAVSGQTAGTVADEQKTTVSRMVNGQSVTQPAGTFTITSASTGTAAFTVSANKKSVTVPDVISFGGRQFAVTEVSAGAFKGSKIRTVTIGKNIKKIRKNAFKKSKVTKLVIKSKKLTKASVKGSLKGSKVKSVQVKAGSKKENKKYVKKYKSLFTKKNAGKKVSVK